MTKGVDKNSFKQCVTTKERNFHISELRKIYFMTVEILNEIVRNYSGYQYFGCTSINCFHDNSPFTWRRSNSSCPPKISFEK